MSDLSNYFHRMLLQAKCQHSYRATLGDGNGNLYTEKAGFVWARVKRPGSVTPEVIQCTKVTAAYGAPVMVEWHVDGHLEATETDPTESREFWQSSTLDNRGYGTGEVAAHASLHGYFGADPVFLDTRQLLPLATTLILATPGLSVYLEPVLYYWGQWAAWNGGNLDLTTYVPTGTGEQRIVITGIDVTTGTAMAVVEEVTTVTYSSGTIEKVPFTMADVAAIDLPEYFLPSMAVRLYTGQTRVERYDIFMDCRNLVRLPQRKHNYQATVAPAVTDDRDTGYQVGSHWYMPTSRKIYVCMDNTPGTAYWYLINTGGSTGTAFESLYIQGTNHQISFQSGGSYFSTYNDAGVGMPIILSIARGTLDTPANVAANDTYPSIQWWGYYGGAFRTGATLTAQVIGTPGSGSMGTQLFLKVSADGSATPTDILDILATRVNFSVPIAFPVLTTTQRDALSPSDGWAIYNDTTDRIQVRAGGAWADVGGGSALAIEENDVSVVAAASTLNFVDLNAEDAGSNQANVYLNIPPICTGRLTLTSATYVTSSDVTAASTIYYCASAGGSFHISLYDGTRWRLHSSAEISLALSGLTSGKNYDVFIYNNAGTLTIELSAAWSSDSARTDALTTVDGILVKSGATTRRYIGTIRTTATTTTEDSRTKRFVWNYYNRVSKYLHVFDGTYHTYTGTTWQYFNNTTTNKFEFVTGVTEDAIICTIGNSVYMSSASTGPGAMALGYDRVDQDSDAIFTISNLYTTGAPSGYTTVPAAGYHYVAAIEKVFNSGTANYNAFHARGYWRG